MKTMQISLFQNGEHFDRDNEPLSVSSEPWEQQSEAAAGGEWKSAFNRLKSLYGQTIAHRI